MRVADLFSGCGGLSLGFVNAGLDVVAAFDNWAPAIEVYRANLDHPILEQNLSDVAATVKLVRSFQPEMIIGGPPCQDFSHAGKRSEGSRADLTIKFAEIVTAIMPKWFLMENVARASTSAAFQDATSIFERAGYGLTIAVLDASLCGVPQKRKRLVCIGKQGEQNGFLSARIRSAFSTRPMTVRDYFGGELETEHYYRHPRNYSRRAIYSIDEPAATIRGVNRPIPLGYKRHSGDVVDPESSRPLTTAERARIQTFPKSFRWLGSKTAQEQMIGNAVPVKLAEFVARAILDYEAGVVCSGLNLALPLQEAERVRSDGFGGVQDMAYCVGSPV
jgi:DNA (cytosine-5)-methyltransferase 1